MFLPVKNNVIIDLISAAVTFLIKYFAFLDGFLFFHRILENSRNNCDRLFRWVTIEKFVWNSCEDIPLDDNDIVILKKTRIHQCQTYLIYVPVDCLRYSFVIILKIKIALVV